MLIPKNQCIDFYCIAVCTFLFERQHSKNWEDICFDDDMQIAMIILSHLEKCYC